MHQMERRSPLKIPKKSTNLTLSEALIDEARQFGVNLSEAAEEGIAAAVRTAHGRRWVEENSDGFEAWNRYVERHGIPLAEFRKF